MTNQELMEKVALEVFDACLDNGVETENAFHAALNAARNVSEQFRIAYECHKNLLEAVEESGAPSPSPNYASDRAWDVANDAAWDQIFDAARLAVVSRGLRIAEDEGLTDQEQIDNRVDAYLEEVLD